jgi:hypothetical protein
MEFVACISSKNQRRLQREFSNYQKRGNHTDLLRVGIFGDTTKIRSNYGGEVSATNKEAGIDHK